MRWRVLLVVLVVATAGCNAIGGGDGGETTTLTPVPVPSDAPASGPGSTVAPGVWADGRLDLDRLGEAQRDAVGNQSFRWRAVRNWTGTVGNVTTHSRTYDVIVLETATRFSRSATLSSGHPIDRFYRRYSEFANGRDHFVRAESFYWNGTRYGQTAVEPSRDRLVSATTFAVRKYLSVESVTVEPVVVDGRTRYRITGEDAGDSWGPSVRNYTVTADVTPGGLVRTLSAQWTAIQGESVETIRYRFAFETIGNVTVTQPAWVETASERVENGTTLPV